MQSQGTDRLNSQINDMHIHVHTHGGLISHEVLPRRIRHTDLKRPNRGSSRSPSRFLDVRAPLLAEQILLGAF